MERLSRNIEDIEPDYCTVVVGSGYGGAIAAARLTEIGSVCLLERGKELHPGEYPRTLCDAVDQIQVEMPAGHRGSPTAMFDFRLGRDISVLVGCGLGGTSLINANVALEPKTSKMKDKKWPPQLRRDGFLDPYYAKARDVLDPQQYPADRPLQRLDALERAAQTIGGKFDRAWLNVTFKSGLNKAGMVDQRACVLCGDCVSGCNYWAKNTVLMNYLPLAHKDGAHIFTEAAVRSIGLGQDQKWRVLFHDLREGRQGVDAPALSVTADRVVLAAGTLGSTEILLRSRRAGLDLSKRLGERFSGNGDLLGFAYDVDQPVHGVGLGRRPPPPAESAVGPTITGTIDLRDRRRPDAGLLIEDGAMPGPVGSLLPTAFAAAAPFIGAPANRSALDSLQRRVREPVGVLQGPYRGPLDRTFAYLVMSEDDDEGRLLLRGDRLRVSWLGVADRPVVRHHNHTLAQATRGLKGTYVPDPLWTGAFGHALITVHPLGGCVMAADGYRGVVDYRGRVFTGRNRRELHRGLYVADGSIVPIPLGVNPLLTISALAEWISEQILINRPSP